MEEVNKLVEEPEISLPLANREMMVTLSPFTRDIGVRNS